MNLIFADNSGPIETVSINYDGSDIVQNVCDNVQSEPNPNKTYQTWEKRVETEEELIYIIKTQASAINVIYLTFDWVINEEIIHHAGLGNFKIVGRDPKTGKRYSIIQLGSSEKNGINLDSFNSYFSFEIFDAKVVSTTKNGLIYNIPTGTGTPNGITIKYSNVCFEGPKIAENVNGILILENSYFNIDRQAQGITITNLSNAKRLQLEGTNVIKHTAGDGSAPILGYIDPNDPQPQEIIALEGSQTKISTKSTLSEGLSRFYLGDNAQMILDFSTAADRRKTMTFNENGKMELGHNSELIMNFEPNGFRDSAIIKSPKSDLNIHGGSVIVNIDGTKSMASEGSNYQYVDQPFFEFRNINISNNTNSKSNFTFNVKEINSSVNNGYPYKNPRVDHTLIKGNFNSLSNLNIELNTQSNIAGVLASLVNNTGTVANTIDNSSFTVNAGGVGNLFGKGSNSDTNIYTVTNSEFNINSTNGNISKTLFNTNGIILGANNTFNIKANNIDIADGKALINTNYPNDPMNFNNININLELNGYSNNPLFDYKNIESLNNSNINIELTGSNQSLFNSNNGMNIENSRVVFNNHGNQSGSLINSNGNVSLNNSHVEANLNNRIEGNILKANNLKVVDSNLILNLDASENTDSLINLSGDQLYVNYDNYINKLYGSFLVSSPSNTTMMNSNDNLNLDLSIQQINFWNHKETGIDEYQPDIRFFGCGNQIAPFKKVGTGAAINPENQIQSDFKRCGDDPKASENQFDLSNPDLHIWSMGYIQQKINSADTSTGNVSGVSPSNAVNIVRYKDSNATLQSATTISNENQFSIDIPNMKEFIKVDTYFNKLSVDGEIKILQSDGKLELIHVDDQFVFSNLPISSKNTVYARSNKYTYSVLDGRYYDPEWKLTLTQVSPVINNTTNEEIEAATFVYKYSDGTTIELKQGEAIEVYESSKLQNNSSTFTWNEDEGLLMRVSDPRNINSIDEFSAQFEWQLISTK